MAQMVLAVAPETGDSAHFTTRFNRPLRLGPKTQVHVKSAVMTLYGSLEVELGVNDTFSVQLIAGDATTAVNVTVPSGEYASPAALANAVAAAYNNQVGIVPVVDSTLPAGSPAVQCFSAAACTFTAPNYTLSIMGPQQAVRPPASMVLAPDVTTGGGVNIVRAGAGGDWSGYGYVPVAPSFGSSTLMCCIDNSATAAWSGMLAYAGQMLPEIAPPNTRAAIVMERAGAVPLIFVDGFLVAPNGAIGGAPQQGEYFRIESVAGALNFQRGMGGTPANPPLVWQTMHTEANFSIAGSFPVYNMFSVGTMRGLFWTPGLSLTPPPLAANNFGAINPSTQKSATFDNLGLLMGFRPGQAYVSADAAPTVSLVGDQPITAGGVFPSLQIRFNNLPIESYDGASGRVQPIAASLNKDALTVVNNGLQLLYTDPHPTPLACRFVNETALNSLEVEIVDTDGNRATLVGRTQVVVIFS